MTAARPSRLRSQRPAIADRTFGILTLLCGLTVFVILALIVVSTGRESLPVAREMGLRFLTSRTWDPPRNEFGALAFVYGTVMTSFIALLVAVPLSLAIALFLSEVAPHRVRGTITYLIDLLAAIPSVVYGLWGVLVLAPAMTGVYDRVHAAVGPVPVLGGLFSGGSGRSLMTAGLILALMVTPIVTSLSRAVFDTVPVAQREAAYALGTTRWEMVRAAVLPWSRSGVVGAVMLGLGRAMGETIAVALVVGSSVQITARLFAPGDTMAAVIANQFGEASGSFRSALIALGLVLFVITIVVNTGARALVRRTVPA